MKVHGLGFRVKEGRGLGFGSVGLGLVCVGLTGIGFWGGGGLLLLTGVGVLGLVLWWCRVRWNGVFGLYG